MITSKVRSGDTLSGIAARSSTGEKPASRKFVDYTVKSGDTFSGIAAKHDLSLAALKKLNPQVENINVIHPGQKLHVKVVNTPAPAHESKPAPKPQPGKNTSVLPKGIPNTEGMSEAKEYALYSKYVEKHGDAKAKQDLAAGKRVIVGLRVNTPFTKDQPSRGTYDDRLVVMWKDSSGKPHVEEFKANTEPNRRWADDPSQSTKPVGRLVGNQTYHYKKSFNGNFGGNILSPDLRYGNPTVRRDTNRDHRINSKDDVFSGDWGGQAYYFHRGGTNDTYSAGCQTMDQGRFNNFWAALGPQKEFSYVLAQVG
ncbi:LysM peptidoglycan-binding domain-containing protein [Pyxidicoccus sp. MSG2]|uniref:LysM peptidoglycan-binding domain-containing protein n=1 Tax=Pyxidicoccus sp. MSG2 TaxID=2996790 RepID=UPI002270445D|nr:LysM peptidoglycan-binding domain-containing protein [Pyxidicoccus sp. MSG2]MCY1016908.1 LysM peptidoglycan-binding domain-containing protein [Pyxidicoccus sp. MSG2]